MQPIGCGIEKICDRGKVVRPLAADGWLLATGCKLVSLACGFCNLSGGRIFEGSVRN